MRVIAKNEDVRRLIKHPTTGIKFRSDIGASVEWPNDAFTRRRLRDGDIEIAKDDQRAKPKHRGERAEPSGK